MTETDRFDEIFGEKPIRWYHYLIHGGYYICYGMRFFFSRPFKEEAKELNIMESVKTLLETETTDSNIKKSKDLIHIHRIVENTKVRRRLGKWSLRVIVWYLLDVLFIIIGNYGNIPFWNRKLLEIPDSIMIAILTTTTVNIIGLGLIVLRGISLQKRMRKCRIPNDVLKIRKGWIENIRVIQSMTRYCVIVYWNEKLKM